MLGHVFESTLGFCRTKIDAAGKYLKNKAEFFIRGFESTSCGFTPLGAICKNTDGALTEHFPPANFTKWMCTSRNSLFCVCSVCDCTCVCTVSFLWNLSALTCYPLPNNVLYTLGEYVDGSCTLQNPSPRFLMKTMADASKRHKNKHRKQTLFFYRGK